MNINEMTDEALHALSLDVEAAARRANFNSHQFTGIDGRCMGCDARPTYRCATEAPCPGW